MTDGFSKHAATGTAGLDDVLDTVILLRYFEAVGRVRRAISIIKKRTGAHEDTIREYMIGARGLSLGEPLVNFQGVLGGVPTFIGALPQIKGGDG